MHQCWNVGFLPISSNFWSTLNCCQKLGFLAKTLEFVRLNCSTAKILDFLPTLWSFLDYITSLLKIDIVQRYWIFAALNLSSLKSWTFAKSLACPQLLCITATFFDLVPRTGNFLIYNTSLLKKICTFANILEINQIQCTTSNKSDWLTKTGNFLLQFASLLKNLIFCHDPGISSLTMHHC